MRTLAQRARTESPATGGADDRPGGNPRRVSCRPRRRPVSMHISCSGIGYARARGSSMATLDAKAPPAEAPRRPALVRKIIVALFGVLIFQGLLALSLISAQQLLTPRQMPFGVVGPSTVVQAVQTKLSLDPVSYPTKSAAVSAIDQGQIYGAFVTNPTGDTLIVVPAKSFFAQLELEPAFLVAARKLHQPVAVQTLKPLPARDRVGVVAGLLLVPLLIGGYLAAVPVFKAAEGSAAAR